MRAEEIKGLLQSTDDLERLAKFFGEHLPQYRNRWGKMLLRQNKMAIKGYLQELLTHPSLYRESAPKIEVQEGGSPIKENEGAEEQEDEGYPRHYPAELINMLLETRKLIRRKRRLSNELVKLAPTPAPEIVKQVLELSEQIDDNYRIKKEYDRHGNLPVEMTGEGEKIAQEAENLQRELNKLNNRIWRLTARLNNPSERSKSKPSDLQKEKQAKQAQARLIKQKIYELKRRS